jgi:hypothetical protein
VLVASFETTRELVNGSGLIAARLVIAAEFEVQDARLLKVRQGTAKL